VVLVVVLVAIILPIPAVLETLHLQARPKEITEAITIQEVLVLVAVVLLLLVQV
jgi:hypothetical protein